MPEHIPKFRLLTLRERDCLRSLAKGRSSRQVAQELGIAYSTLSKHLAAARRKLEVDTTAQALLLFTQTPEPLEENKLSLSHNGPFSEIVDGSQELADFATRLEGCANYAEAWDTFVETAKGYGINQIILAVIAEPPGQIPHAVSIVGSTLCQDFDDFYQDQRGIGGVDPLAHHVASSTRFGLIDIEAMLADAKQYMPQAVRTAEELVHDTGCRRFLVVPERDAMTGAPLGAAYTVHDEGMKHYQADRAGFEGQLSELTRVFWDTVYRKNYIQTFATLSPRQREALRYAARGFSVIEIAEHMGVSKRSAEKTLASARSALGAPTTAAAVYRAIVYRGI